MSSLKLSQKTGVILLLVVAVYLQSSATIINIPDDYTTIQAGIDASNNGDTVLVQPGTYVENINFNGHNIVLGSLFLTTGDTSHISNTIICDGAEGFVVMFENSEDSTAKITGFTIKNGPSAEPPSGGIGCIEYSSPVIDHNIIWGYSDDLEGSGIICWEYSNPTISNNIIIDNQAHYVGGGISCSFYSNPVIINNIISGNSADGGGGIYCREYCNPVIANNVIHENIAYGVLPFFPYGGAIYSVDSSPEISDNIITGNIAYRFGGGIACEFSGNPTIGNNIISRNTAFSGGGIYILACDPDISGNLINGNYVSDWGGGVRCDNGNISFFNNTVYGNSADGGGGIHCVESSIIITNSIFWSDSARTGNEISNYNCTPIVTYCDVQSGYEGEGNIDADPLFINPDNGDFHLQPGSPCIDAGNPDSPYDPDSTIADIGAFYFDQMVSSDDILSNLPEHFKLHQNYPNPFNASTIICYSLPEPSAVTLDIYDILGRKVETLIDKPQPAGYHRVVWNADNFSSGVYFYKLSTGEFVKSKKMVLLK